MSMLDDMDKKRARNISVVVLIVVLMAGIGFVIDTDTSGSEDPAFNIQYNQNTAQVVQTQGETVESVNMRVTYFDEESENLELSDSTDGIFLANISRSVGEIDQSVVRYNSEIVATKSLPNELQPSSPTISDSLSSSQYRPNESFQLSGQNLVQSEAEITSYQWKMGDGTTYNQSSITHEYSELGTYTAELQATNVRGDTSTKSYTITIRENSDSDSDDSDGSDNGAENSDLIIGTPSIPDSIRVGESFSLDGGVFTDSSVRSYNWRMGDRTEYGEADITHVYESSGNYSITLLVSNGEREESANYAIEVQESEVSLIPRITVVEQSDLSVTLSSRESSSESEIETYEWDFGDGNSVERSITEVEHSYQESGSYNVTLTAITADGETSADSTTVDVESPTDEVDNGGDSSDDNDTDGSNDDNNGDDGGNDNGSNSGNDNGDNNNEQDNTGSGSTVEILMSSTNEGYTVRSVEPSDREVEVLSTNEIGEANPALYLEQGDRYVLKLGDMAYNNPIEIRDEGGTVLFSMTEVGELETDDAINWIEQGTEVRFTATETLIERSSVYASSENRDFEGDLKQYENVDPRFEREEDVVVQMSNNGDSFWRVTEVTGTESYSEVVPDADPADSNPTIHLTEGVRYEFVGIPDDIGERDLSLSFIDIVGGKLLSQNGGGEFNDDPRVGWVDNGSSVEFTVTSEIAGEFERYYAPERDAAMKGSVVVD